MSENHYKDKAEDFRSVEEEDKDAVGGKWFQLNGFQNWRKILNSDWHQNIFQKLQVL